MWGVNEWRRRAFRYRNALPHHALSRCMCHAILNVPQPSHGRPVDRCGATPFTLLGLPSRPFWCCALTCMSNMATGPNSSGGRADRSAWQLDRWHVLAISLISYSGLGIGDSFGLYSASVKQTVRSCVRPSFCCCNSCRTLVICCGDPGGVAGGGDFQGTLVDFIVIGD